VSTRRVQFRLPPPAEDGWTPTAAIASKVARKKVSDVKRKEKNDFKLTSDVIAVCDDETCYLVDRDEFEQDCCCDCCCC
jgi:hypothetical protein